MSKVIMRHTLLNTVLPSPLDATSDPFCFYDQCHTQWFLKGLKNLKKMTIEGYDLRTRLYICVDVSVSWSYTYRCLDGGQWWGVECFPLDEGSERAPDEAESPLSVPPLPPAGLQAGSDHSWTPGCLDGLSQTGEGEGKQLRRGQKTTVTLKDLLLDYLLSCTSCSKPENFPFSWRWWVISGVKCRLI